MYLVGDPPIKARRLVDVTYDAMMRGIAAVKPGATTGDIGHAIQAYAESAFLFRRPRFLRPRRRPRLPTMRRTSCTTAGPTAASCCARA